MGLLGLIAATTVGAIFSITPAGPVAGGLYATMQSAGYTVPVIQSIAMSPATP